MVKGARHTGFSPWLKPSPRSIVFLFRTAREDGVGSGKLFGGYTEFQRLRHGAESRSSVMSVGNKVQEGGIQSRLSEHRNNTAP